MHYDQLVFISGMQKLFNIQKSITKKRLEDDGRVEGPRLNWPLNITR